MLPKKSILAVLFCAILFFALTPLGPALAQVCTDIDGDGYGNPGDASCPNGDKTDCDDTDPNVYPGANKRICDGKDTNCDGKKDFKTDVDVDGDGVAWCAGDCDDNDPNRFPGNTEICDGLDNDCNGILLSTEHDSDGDSYLLCDATPDCNDFDSSVYPGAQEVCSDTIDNNCDGTIDEAGCICPDADADGQTAAVCGGTDCDDSNPAVKVGAVEECNDGIDNDCDGLIDINDPDAVNCPVCTDSDGDGYYVEGGGCGVVDCDDTDPNVYPGAAEICDGKDSNCDGRQASTDVDADADGVAWCAGDCNDNDPNIYPGATEECDGVDNDCNGILLADEHDSDRDGYLLCDATPDCNDFDSSVYPGAQEVCSDNIDNNCDGNIDEADCICPDSDSDGQTAAVCGGTDCDDSDPNVYQGAVEECNDGIDNDCDGLIDINDPDAVNCPACTDSDGDGYYVEGGGCGSIDCDDTDPNVYPGAAEICDGKDSNCDGKQASTDVDADGDGVAWCAGDCNDNDPNIYPGATEICDGVDNDCNGILLSTENDSDGDGYRLCDPIPDCNDFDASTYPGAAEVCSDNIDNNCDGNIDEIGCICPDSDNDGQTAAVCGGTDCDDSDPNVYQGAIEECNDGIDNDCDGLIDINDPDAVNCPACTDSDGDGYYVEGGGCGSIDCDDTDPNVYPGAAEICDGKDSNCDGKQASTDVDVDGDGVAWCAGDCNDNDPDNFPGNREICDDGIDNDCDNKIDGVDSDCIFTCTTKTSPKNGPHMFNLLDPADDSVISTSCNRCHFDDSGTIDQRTECQRCHADPSDTSDPLNGVIKQQYPLNPPYGYGNAPNIKLHSSTVVGAKYGDWDMQCLNCHNPHMQEQDDTYGTTYGKLIKEYICFNNPVTGLNIEEIVEFTSATGAGSFADGPPHNKNICEMCHTQTNHHRNDGTAPGDLDTGGAYIGHNDGAKCTDCHTHATGFAPAGGTPAPPHDTAGFTSNCNYCHVDDGAGNIDYAAKIPDSKCEQCHTPLGALKAHYMNAPDVLTHSDVNGSGKYIYINDCVDCHNPMYPQSNTKLLRSTLSGSVIAGSNIIFTAHSGADSFADGSPFNENVCETCHVMTNHHRYDGSAPADNDLSGYIGHNDSTDCTTCHAHNNAFLPEPHPQANTDCSICHLNQNTQEPDIQELHNNDCQICHTTNFDSTFLGSLGTWNQECTACHNPNISETGSLQTHTKGHRCILCHGEQKSTSDRENIHKKHTDKANCVVCHGFIPYTGVEIGSGNRDICHLCHGTSKDNSNINDIHKKMIPEGTSCLECHADERPPVDVVPGTPVGNSEHVCKICHDNKDPDEFTNKMEDLHKKHTGKKIGCGSCHADAILQDDREPMPDVDDNRRSLVDRFDYNECSFCHEGGKNATVETVHKKHVAKMWQWCYNCHEGTDQRPIGLLPPVTQPSESCKICHGKKQYKDQFPFDKHKRHADKNKCYVCHQTMPPLFDWPKAWMSP